MQPVFVVSTASEMQRGNKGWVRSTLRSPLGAHISSNCELKLS
jgi:hypothetical protein